VEWILYFVYGSCRFAGRPAPLASLPVLLVLVFLLALLALITCLLLAIIVDLELAAAALSPAAVLGWLGNLAINIKLAVALRISGFELYMIGNVVVLAARN